jgi:hypothetical protein
LTAAKETFLLTGIEWDAASDGDKLLKKEHEKLSAEQYAYFAHLADQLFENMDEEDGLDSFGDGFGFNWPSWHRFLLKIVASIDSESLSDDRNCFLSSLGSQSERIITGSVGIDAKGEVVFKSDCLQHILLVSQLITMLKFGCVPERGQQTSHRCMNRKRRFDSQLFNPCLNLEHVIREDSAENKSRNDCIMGYAFSCRHEEKCIFTDIDGYWLPCINAEDFQECHCKEQYCHTAKRFLQCELFLLTFDNLLQYFQTATNGMVCPESAS